METYRKMYFALFNSVTDALTALDEGDCATAKSILQYAQSKAEEIYMEDFDEKTQAPQTPTIH